MMVNNLFTEKYRPKKLDDVAGQGAIVKRLKHFVKMKNMPHLLFLGRAGVGKTSCAIALANELYADRWRENFLELNASDERGIDVIRGKIKNYARTTKVGDVPFKIVFLDESDNLTSHAQSALRRTMERYSMDTRFILTANDLISIIPPIQDRCGLLRFKALNYEEMMLLLKEIVRLEGIDIEKSAISNIASHANGSVRRAVNYLQMLSLGNENGKIVNSDFYELFGGLYEKDTKELIKLTFKSNNDFGKLREKLWELLYVKCVTAQEILHSIFDYTARSSGISDKLRTKILIRIGDIEHYLVEGSDDVLQLMSFFCWLQNTCKVKE